MQNWAQVGHVPGSGAARGHQSGRKMSTGDKHSRAECTGDKRTGDEHFQDFFARIEAPALRAVARHWGEARAGRRMPAWRDIDPLKIVPYLPIVWAWRYDRQDDRFTGRLAGDAITRAFGRSLRGADPDTARTAFVEARFGEPHAWVLASR